MTKLSYPSDIDNSNKHNTGILTENSALFWEPGSFCFCLYVEKLEIHELPKNL
jgi:hypothetical protein